MCNKYSYLIIALEFSVPKIYKILRLFKFFANKIFLACLVIKEYLLSISKIKENYRNDYTYLKRMSKNYTSSKKICGTITNEY